MRASRTLLSLIALVVAVGAGAWYSTRHEAGSPSSIEIEARTTETAAGGPIQPEREQMHGRGDASAGEGAARVEIGPEPEEDDPEEFAFTSMPKSRSKRISIARNLGRAVDEGGQPVAGARVLGSLGETAAGALLDAPANAGRVREAKTSAEGRFELDRLEAGSVRVAIRADSFAPFDAKATTLAPGASLDLGDVRLERGFALAGRVVDEAGRPVKAAEIFLANAPLFGPVQLLGSAAASPIGVSDEEGGFALRPLASGTWTLLVRHAEFPDATFEVRTEPREELKLVLQAGAILRGHIADFVGRELPPLCVLATPADGLRLFRQTRPQGGDESWLHRPNAADVDAEGKFELHGLVPGARYAVRAVNKLRLPDVDREGYDLWAPSTLESAGAKDCEVIYSSGCTVVGEVVDSATGAPIERMEVCFAGMTPSLLADERGKPKHVFQRGLITATDLRAIFGTPPDESKEFAIQGQAHVVIDAPGHECFRSIPQPVTPGGRIDFGRIALAPLPRYDVRVEDAADQKPISGASVSLVPDPPIPHSLPWRARNVSRATSGPDGIAHLTSVTSPGARLGAHCPGYASRTIQASGSVAPDAPPVVLQL